MNALAGRVDDVRLAIFFGKERDMIAICVGHGRKIGGRPEGGAVATNGVAEHTFNLEVARLLSDELARRGVSSVVISEYGGASYFEAMRWLGRELERYGRGVEAAIELHFNSADSKSARGYEFLCWKGSKAGRRLADAFRDSLMAKFHEARDRGVKEIDASDRGALFLRFTSCPAMIAEPFFGSNAEEVAEMMSEVGKAKLVAAYADALVSWRKK